MSGVYLIIWDNQLKEKCPVLSTTKGGYPHITLAYTGNHLSKEELCKTSNNIFEKVVLNPIKLTRAYVNSFKVKETGQMRHDVLMEVAEAHEITVLRDVYLKNMYSNSDLSLIHI